MATEKKEEGFIPYHDKILVISYDVKKIFPKKDVFFKNQKILIDNQA